MKSQSVKEMLAIAFPFALVIIGFVVLMGGFFEMTVKIGEAYIPHKVASMVLHTLTGSTECLVYEGDSDDLPHKGLLDINKLEAAVTQSAARNAMAYVPVSDPSVPNPRAKIPGISGQLDCATIPCWRWRAIVNVPGKGVYKFGDDANDDLIWGGANPSEVVTVDLGEKFDEWWTDVETDFAKTFGTTPTTNKLTDESVAIEDLSGFTTIAGGLFGENEYHYAPSLTSRKMPVVIQDGDERYLGSIRIDVATIHTATCQNEVDLMVLSSAWAG